MYPVLFKIGFLTIYTYGFFVFLGILAGYLFSLKEAPRYNFKRETVSDLIFWTIIGGFISSRLGYIIINWRDFLKAPLSFIISPGGFVFYPGLAGGLLSLFIFTKRRKLPLLKILDFLSPSLSLAHSLGRIGCFFYGCCYGRPTKSFIGIKFPSESPAGALGVRVIPTQLISSFFLLVIFVILLFLRNKKLSEGKIFFSYLGLYSAFRFIIEFYRGDCIGYFFNLSVGQWVSLGVFLISFVFLFRKRQLKT